MKLSSSQVSSVCSTWGISSTVVAAACCSLTAVVAWTTAIRSCNSSSCRTTTFRAKSSRGWWLRQQISDNTDSRKNPTKPRLQPSNRLQSTSKAVRENGNENDQQEENSGAEQRHSRFTTVEDTMMEDGGNLRVHPIGVVRSVYRLCVGTPRQGMLAPHARARIELHNLNDDRTGVAAAASVDGLQHYSHIWIVFIFHLNTVGKRKHSKISPPALGGGKVGVLATRSPHRLNPIGMTLAKLDAIRTIPSYRTTEGQKKGGVTVLDISGTDLVDGTPVIDIKPYVPSYDAIPLDECTVPEWVSEGLATTRTVRFTLQAERDLHDILLKNPQALDFYGSTGNPLTASPLSIEETFEEIKACIEEVLAIDVRSRHQTNKARKGQSRAEKADRMHKLDNSSNIIIGATNTTNSLETSPMLNENICTQQLDNLLISFNVFEIDTVEREESMGSGAEDAVTVLSIALVDLQ
jgi:tRNA (adenine37-N6)-methyltransferase